MCFNLIHEYHLPRSCVIWYPLVDKKYDNSSTCNLWSDKFRCDSHFWILLFFVIVVPQGTVLKIQVQSWWKSLADRLLQKCRCIILLIYDKFIYCVYARNKHNENSNETSRVTATTQYFDTATYWHARVKFGATDIRSWQWLHGNGNGQSDSGKEAIDISTI